MHNKFFWVYSEPKKHLLKLLYAICINNLKTARQIVTKFNIREF